LRAAIRAASDGLASLRDAALERLISTVMTGGLRWRVARGGRDALAAHLDAAGVMGASAARQLG
jgi:predicted short-subunit dehydrogenase-like oxidoreductase (DUF2520 family)